ncbi:MAG: hypothetical protein ACRBM6_27000 [Geminicoccales bacterium]
MSACPRQGRIKLKCDERFREQIDAEILNESSVDRKSFIKVDFHHRRPASLLALQM